MQTERVTFLATPQVKAALSARAGALGISTGEYIRRRIEEEDELSPQQEAELSALVAQVNDLLPQMRESLDRSIATLDRTHEKVDALLRDAGIRK